MIQTVSISDITSYNSMILSGVTVGFTTNNYRDNENKGYIIVTCTASGPVFNDVTLNIKDSPNTALSQSLIYTILLLVHDIYY